MSEFAAFLVEQGIDRIFLNPDAVLETRLPLTKTRKDLGTLRTLRAAPWHATCSVTSGMTDLAAAREHMVRTHLAARGINAGDRVAVDLAGGTIKNLTTGASFTFAPLVGAAQDLIKAGGLVELTRQKLAARA